MKKQELIIDNSNRTCATCSKCKTAACESPDKCAAGGYKYYSGQPRQHWRNCRQCGAKLLLTVTKTETEETGYEYKVCPKCGHRQKVMRACC